MLLKSPELDLPININNQIHGDKGQGINVK